MAEFSSDIVYLKRDPEFPDAKLPEYGSALASGMDLFAAATVKVEPFQPVVVPTGWLLAWLDPDYELQIRSRSGNTLKRRFMVANQPGTVDADYRGKIGVIVLNFNCSPTGTATPLIIEKGEKIAQMVPAPVKRMKPQESDTQHDTQRGAGGFGSTGR